MSSVQVLQFITLPSTPIITSLISTYSDQLTVTWTSVPTATRYNVSINDSVNTLVPIPSTGAPQYMWNFTGLANNTVYTVSVVAINCAGSSNPATNTGRLRIAPESNNDALRVGIGVGIGVGVPVVLAVIVGVVYCTFKGESSPHHKGPAKQTTSPKWRRGTQPAVKPKEALMFAMGSVSTKSDGNKSAQPPANDDGVA
eukprot:Em0025g38a